MRVDIVSDMVCPWCWIGERRLMKALELTGVPLQVTWHPYQLDVDVPDAGVPWREYMAAKFGGSERLEGVIASMAPIAVNAGIELRYDRIQRYPNTTAAHALSQIAAESGRQAHVQQALFRAYFTLGEDIGDVETLRQIAVDCGLDGPSVVERLRSRADWPLVTAAIEDAAKAGISGVPLFIFDRRLAVSGAQEPEFFAEAIREAMSTAGASCCGGGGCCGDHAGQPIAPEAPATACCRPGGCGCQPSGTLADIAPPDAARVERG
jgi:predicted DsbA family dithiol-disulfide isomerase